MWASEAGHKLQKELFGIDKIRKGQMAILENHSKNLVTLEDNEQQKELPFHIKLKDFRIEYYEPQYLQVRTKQGNIWRIPVEIGTEFPLGDDFGTVTILRTFENFKINIEDGKNVPFDDPKPGFNPTLEVQIESPVGEVAIKYVFERFGGHTHPEDKFLLSYHRTISDYISELQVIENDKVVAEKDIEVNHPLHYGGYHFYQQSYDDKAGQYTVLMVVSDTGIAVVFAGYWMLCIGVIWHLWLRRPAVHTRICNCSLRLWLPLVCSSACAPTESFRGVPMPGHDLSGFVVLPPYPAGGRLQRRYAYRSDSAFPSRLCF
jgi:hypothetical protein